MVKKKSTSFILARSAFRSLKSGIAQFISIVVIGAIAVTLFVGLGANADSFESRVEEVYQKGHLPSLWLTTKSYDEVDEETLQGIVGDRGQVEGRTYLPAMIAKKDVYCVTMPSWPTVDCPYDVITLNDAPLSDSYLLLDKELQQKDGEQYPGKFSLGEEINVAFNFSSYLDDESKASLEKLNNPTFLAQGGTNVLGESEIVLKMKVTGFMSYPENITKSTYNSSVCLFSDALFRETFHSLLQTNYRPFICNLILSKLPDMVSFFSDSEERFLNPNQYLVKANDEKETPQIKKDIEHYFDGKENNNLYLLADRNIMPFYATLNADVTQARQFTFVFPAVFFLVAVLVILTTLSQMIVKERTQIGTMKAIGVTNRQIYGNYELISLSLVFLGTLIGEILGPIIVPKILGNKYNILYALPSPKYVFPLWEGIATALIFLLVTALTAFLVCRKTVQLPPSQSMRPEPPDLKLRPTKRKGRGRVCTLSMKMALRNIRLDKKKSVMVIMGILGCTALLTCGFGIEDTVLHGIESDIKTFRNDDITLTYSRLLSYSEAKEGITGIEGIVDLEPTRASASTFYVADGTRVTRSLTVLAPDTTHFDFRFDKNEVAMSTKAARLAGAKVGDILTFDFDGKTYTAPVGLVYEAFYFHGIMIHADSPFLESVDVKYNGALVDCQNGYIEKLDKKLETLNFVSESQTQKEWEEYIGSTLSSVLVMTNAVKIFAILLALVALYNLSLLNFREKIREFATLKVLGFRIREITLSLLTEAMVLTLIGVAFGLALGYPFLLGVLGTNQVEVVEYLYWIKPLSYVYSFLLTAVVVLAINFVLALRIRHVKMVESLKSVE